MQKITSLSLADCSRLQHVKRWHIVDMLKDQSVAEHSFMVALIARELIRISGKYASKASVSEILEFALVHDVDEVITGDIPSPVKKVVDFTNLQNRANHTPTLPNMFVQRIVKIADFIEAIYHLQKYGMPGPTKDYTLNTLNKNLSKMTFDTDTKWDLGENKWQDVVKKIWKNLDCSNLTIVEEVCDV